jgi:hypothetical protein
VLKLNYGERRRNTKTAILSLSRLPFSPHLAVSTAILQGGIADATDKDSLESTTILPGGAA